MTYNKECREKLFIKYGFRDKIERIELLKRTRKSIRLDWSNDRHQDIVLNSDDIDSLILGLKKLICLLETEKRDGYLL